MSDSLIGVSIASRSMAARDIVSLDLVSVDGALLPPFTPGAHIDLHLPGGLIRQYSLCNPSIETGSYRVAVLLDPETRGGSRAVHALSAGDRLFISAPRNHFPLVESSADIVLLGGGIGITPLLAMAYALYRESRSFTLHYCSRSSDRMAFREDLHTAPFADRVQLHFDDGDASQHFRAAEAMGSHVPGRYIYTCGPTGFLAHVLATAKTAGWPDEAVRYERFSADVDTHGGHFTIIAQRSGLSFTVGDDQTIAAALAANGIAVPLSCEQGVCGTCLTKVLEGVPDHRDLYLTDAERAANDSMTICCSRALTPTLVLDV
ncbi:2Fe-2S iron-sulfur cluster-binding protein [Sphingosinicella sp.]|uniref:PDR/VanB family oxidoreductase n=1 Tax=Sphingosinicella sp. TaxID=1917971 RepID=UPI0035B1949C